MFGYILPEKPELKVKEYELFKAYYCGVCKAIGKRSGQLARLTLNYDSTFIAILISSIIQSKPVIKRERCIAHPYAKRLVVRNCPVIDYASDINIVLAYYSMIDNWKDERSIPAGIGMGMLSKNFKKIRRRYQKKCDIIKFRLDELGKLEDSKCSSMDEAAEPFAKLMEEIALYPPACDDIKTEKILRWIGYNLGKWIYLMDAFDDIEKDIKKKNYNPLLEQYRFNGEDIEEFKSNICEQVEFNLTYTMSEIAKAYELLEKNENSGIVENIIYMGMLRKTETILGKGSCNKIEKSI